MSEADNRIQVLLKSNSIMDEGNGVLTFTDGLTLSDESEQKNGTRYDIESMQIDDYNGDVFIDHDYSMQSLVGKAFGIAKQGKRLIAEGIKFAVEENPNALFIYKMVRNGYARAVSIGTQGELNEDGVYVGSRLLEFSFVGIGNNDNAVINSAEIYGDSYTNSIQRAIANGLEAPEEVEATESEPEEKLEESTKDKKEDEMSESTDTTPAVDTSVDSTESSEETKVDANAFNEMKQQLAELSNLFANAHKPAASTAINGAPTIEVEPVIEVNGYSAQAKNMTQKERTKYQIEALWQEKKRGNMSRNVADMYTAINSANIADIKSDRKLSKRVPHTNAAPVLGMDDESGWGNWVPCVEFFNEVELCKTDYDCITSRFGFDDQDQCFYAWALATSSVNMQPVQKCDDGADGNLKPITGARDHAKQLRQMNEYAGVTPICDAATKFLAGDILGTISNDYAQDYARKQAEFVIGAIQQAVEQHVAGIVGVGGTDIVVADPTASAAWDGTATGIGDAIRKACSCCPGGVLMFNCETEYELMKLCSDCGDGYAFSTGNVAESGQLGRIWGKNYVVVPNELMPTLGSGATVTVVGADPLTGAPVDVVITHAIFCIDPSSWKGVRCGGFNYDVRGDVAYEVDGVVRSAYQRDELVARGYFFMGGGILNPECAVGILA